MSGVKGFLRRMSFKEPKVWNGECLFGSCCCNAAFFRFFRKLSLSQHRPVIWSRSFEHSNNNNQTSKTTSHTVWDNSNLKQTTATTTTTTIRSWANRITTWAAEELSKAPLTLITLEVIIIIVIIIITVFPRSTSHWNQSSIQTTIQIWTQIDVSLCSIDHGTNLPATFQTPDVRNTEMEVTSSSGIRRLHFKIWIRRLQMQSPGSKMLV